MINSIIDYLKRLVVCVLLSMLVTAIVAFVIVRKLEVIAGASLFGLFISPSIVIYYILDLLQKTQKQKFIGFIMPMLAILMFFIAGLILAMNGMCDEGEDQMTKLVLVTIFIGGAVVYFFMSKIKWLKGCSKLN